MTTSFFGKASILQIMTGLARARRCREDICKAAGITAMRRVTAHIIRTSTPITSSNAPRRQKQVERREGAARYAQKRGRVSNTGRYEIVRPSIGGTVPRDLRREA